MPYLSQRGDPGIGSFLRKAGGAIAGTALSLVPGGGLARTAARAVGSVISRRPAAAAIGAGTALSLVAMPGTGISPIAPARRLARNVREAGSQLLSGDACPKGFHLNKSGYFTKSEGFIAPRSKCVRNRQRNAANGRALRRAVGRVQSFNGLVKRSRKSLKALASI